MAPLSSVRRYAEGVSDLDSYPGFAKCLGGSLFSPP